MIDIHEVHRTSTQNHEFINKIIYGTCKSCEIQKSQKVHLLCHLLPDFDIISYMKLLGGGFKFFNRIWKFI